MRYFVIPPAVKMTVATGQPEVEFSFQQFLDECVWPDPAWRTRAAQCAFYDCQEKLADATPGALVELTDEQFEIFEPIATLRGRALPNGGNMARRIGRLIRPILQARTTRPGDPPATEHPTKES